ncbi:MAG: penicillin acylase family protein [Chloroflexota bacterium]|nr:penicillin acylase family protein [Chloroflexota bacterium]
MRRVRRAVAIALALLVSTVLIAGTILVYRPHPTLRGDIRVLGMHERGEILRDRFGVPHIFARNAHDLFFMQGYVLAQDRLFQMDLYRRAAHGTLSEVLGEATLAADKLTRTLSLGRAARRDEELLGVEARVATDAFAEGVNKFIQQYGESLPFEFVLLGYRPHLWSPLDSLAIMKLQAYDQATNYETELVRLSIAQRLGVAAIAPLFPDPPGTPGLDAAWARIAPHVGVVEAPRPADRENDGREVLRAIFGDPGSGAGSNCWAVGGSRTATGRPLLAGDPHLGVRNPSIWYEVALDGAGYRVAGFTIPGVPGVILGHNDRIAWSLTVAFADQQDLYLERADPADRSRFLYRGAFEPATVHRETIRVKGRREPVPFEVVVTRNGPILTPILKDQSAPLALRWTALDGGRSLDGILAIDRARDWESFRAAASIVEGPALTLCYADVDGHIGHSIVGRIPTRASAEDGRLPVPGWTGEHEWREPLAAERIPGVLDPSDGLSIIANQRWTTLESAGSPSEWDPGVRAQRARELLGGIAKVSVDDLRRAQTDVLAPAARPFRDLIEALPRSSAGGDGSAAERAKEIVRGWDGVLSAGSAGAAVYETFVFHLITQVFKEKLGEAVFATYLADGRPAFALQELVARPSDPWLVARGVPLQGADGLTARALASAADELVRRQGADPAGWRWGALHRITFVHPLGSAIPFGLLNLGPYERPGDDDTLNDAPYDFAKPYELRSHASLRTIVDLADIDGSWSVLPTGQSGQPAARHWGDQTPLWLRGDLKPMPLGRERIEVEYRLVLRAR